MVVMKGNTMTLLLAIIMYTSVVLGISYAWYKLMTWGSDE